MASIDVLMVSLLLPHVKMEQGASFHNSGRSTLALTSPA